MKVWRSDETEAEAKCYAADDVASAAAMAADHDHAHRDGWEWTWPVLYTVWDEGTGRLWAIEVEREHVPHFVPSKPQEIPMPPMVHVLWGARAVCDDLRLRDIPGRWPADQRWISLRDLADSAQLVTDVTCEACKRRAPGLIVGLMQKWT